MAGTCIKGSYRDKGINTSTKCGESDGRSSSKSYLFGVSPSLPLPFLSLPFSWFAFIPVPSCPPLSTAAAGSSRYSIPVARWWFESAIPPRQTRLGSILPNESRTRLSPFLQALEIRTGDAAAVAAPRPHILKGQFLTLWESFLCPC